MTKEFWIEVNIDTPVEKQDELLLESLVPFLDTYEGIWLTWHFFREPELRFRIRAKDKLALSMMKRSLTKGLDGLGLKWWYGRHGVKGKQYYGEEDRYGKYGWLVAQDYFHDGAKTALRLIRFKRWGELESPLWSKGKGNPWEGGSKNPWKEREEDPMLFNWSRIVHLISNQMGFNMEKEAELCAKQSKRYKQLVEEQGLTW
jgi:hypothetical protein